MVEALEDKKAEDILILDLTDIASFTDYFIICSGSSNRMLQALMETTLKRAKGKFNLPSRSEGEPQDGWMLADFGDIIVHIFSADQREYYQLEDLWSKGKVLLHVQ
ncbi:MAG: ribosome silencing factor [Chloroflexi bacterium]|nr:ribosome silencing factor [Chloroflexota bacterium]